MIHTCDACKFTFSRVGKIDACPDCGKPSIREAAKNEKDEYIKYHAELKKGTKLEQERKK